MMSAISHYDKGSKNAGKVVKGSAPSRIFAATKNQKKVGRKVHEKQ